MKQRIQQLKKSLSDGSWLFGGPSERELVKQMLNVMGEMEERIRRMEKDREDTEG